MGFLTRVARVVESFRGGNPLENPSVPLGGPGFLAWLMSGEVTESGEQINDFTALQQITVYNCVRILGESVGSLPVKVYEKLTNGREEAKDHPLFDMLCLRPNPEMTACSFFECMTGCLSLTGNCYAQIDRNKLGDIAGFYPLHPHKTQPVRVDQQLLYKTSDGEPLGKWRLLKPEDVLHVPLFSFDGIMGLSPILQAKQSIGLARAAEKYGARFFGNGSRPGGVLSPKMGQKIDEKTISQIRETWLAMQGGINQGKTAVLPGEWNYAQIGLSPEESQFLETRKFSRADIAGLFRVPPHMVGDTTRLSNSNHEQASLQFVTDTLRPYMTKLEQEINSKLMPRMGRNAGHYFVQFDVKDRLRGDFQTTMQGYALGRQWGFYSANDIRQEQGLKNIGPQGDVYLAPVNMVNLKNMVPGFIPPTPPAPSAPAGGDPPDPEGSQDPADPQEEGGEPSAETKSLQRYLPAYIGLFRDAAGRFCKRDKRDLEALSPIFSPALTSLGTQIRDEWALMLGLGDDFDEVNEVVQQQLHAAARHLDEWPGGDPDQIAMAELTRAIRGMEIETARRAAVAAAQRKVGV